MGFMKLNRLRKNEPVINAGVSHRHTDAAQLAAAAPEASASRQSTGSQAIQQKLSDRIQMKTAGMPIQREALEGSELEEEELQMKRAGAPVQREALEGSELEEEELQMKRAGAPVQRAVETSPGAAKSNSRMPDYVQAKMESSFGSDFSDVKIHSNSSKATDVGALAYTQGTDIHFAPGQYDPESTSGQELLGHELTHVVQQKEGTVKATTEANGVPVNDDPGLEKEADELGRRAARS